MTRTSKKKTNHRRRKQRGKQKLAENIRKKIVNGKMFTFLQAQDFFWKLTSFLSSIDVTDRPPRSPLDIPYSSFPQSNHPLIHSAPFRRTSKSNNPSICWMSKWTLLKSDKLVFWRPNMSFSELKDFFGCLAKGWVGFGCFIPRISSLMMIWAVGGEKCKRYWLPTTLKHKTEIMATESEKLPQGPHISQDKTF